MCKTTLTQFLTKRPAMCADNEKLAANILHAPGSACPAGFPSNEWMKAAFRLCPEAESLSPGAFANPVKHRLSALCAALEVFLCSPAPTRAELEAFAECLEDAMRVMAARSIAPDEVLRLFFAVKNFENWPLNPKECERADEAAILAMRFYCRFREQLTMLKLDEERRKYKRVLRYIENGREEQP